jgi:hypothetical protein
MDQSVMVPAEQDQVVETGLTPIGPNLPAIWKLLD